MGECTYRSLFLLSITLHLSHLTPSLSIEEDYYIEEEREENRSAINRILIINSILIGIVVIIVIIIITYARIDFSRSSLTRQVVGPSAGSVTPEVGVLEINATPVQSNRSSLLLGLVIRELAIVKVCRSLGDVNGSSILGPSR